MIIIKLQGGLGNQMFQYATARGVSASSETIVFDLSFLTQNSTSSDTFTARSFELQIFKNAKFKLGNKLLMNTINGVNIPSKVLKKLFFREIKFFKQHENEFINGLNDTSCSKYLDGYFQSEKYFLRIRKSILKEFCFPPLDSKNIEILHKINSLPNSTSIHVRRGDYNKLNVLKYHGVLPGDYYNEAIELISCKIKDVYYFIFSDDIDWCKSELKYLDSSYLTYVDLNKDEDAWKDMYLMTQCKHHIIANSSFSWWGAWLSEHGGLKYAPKQWFNPKVANFNIRDFIPASWQIIDNA